eukprot:562212-Pelagomonas_calceolata.AAC.1
MYTARTTNQHSRQPPLECPAAPPEIAMKLKLRTPPACGGGVSCTLPYALASTCGRACLPTGWLSWHDNQQIQMAGMEDQERLAYSRPA